MVNKLIAVKDRYGDIYLIGTAHIVSVAPSSGGLIVNLSDGKAMLLAESPRRIFELASASDRLID